MARRKKRKHLKGYVIPLMVLTAVLVLLLFRTADRFSQPKEWYLILVNQDHPLSRGYEPELTELTNGERVDSRILPYLQAMFDQARSEGIDLFVRSGYRSYDAQKEILETRIAAYEEEGYSHEDAVREAGSWVMKPGTSEHQTGLCVDVNSEDDSRMNQTYSWLQEHCWEYGFVERYPQDKSSITGVYHEPWHYRYVGEEAARDMTENNLCLEEYLGQ